MARRNTPDILGDVMLGIPPQESNKARKPERNNVVKQENHKAINTASNKTIAVIAKEKATFNLSKKLLQDLEDSWIEIRKLRGDKRVSKTDIVEFSISQILADFKAIKQESKLYISLVSNKTIKQ